MSNSSSYGALDPAQTHSTLGPQRTCAELFWGPSTACHHIAHGLANALMMDEVLRFNAC